MAFLSSQANRWRPRLNFNKRFSRITICTLISIVLVILLFWTHQDAIPFLRARGPEYYLFNTTSSFNPASVSIPETKSKEDLCATFPKHLLNYVQPVLKMGHGEKRDKIEAQLDSVSACFDKEDLLIFSDLEETVGSHQSIDILGGLPSTYYENPDFINYIWQKEMQANGTLDKDLEATKRINGWILDKYKFLPMVERTWLAKPEKAFYFFYETDTYVVWDNVFRFLQTFDPDKPIYMGSPSPGRHDVKKDIKTWFANGGPGFVLSRGAIKQLLHRKATPSGQYTEPTLLEKWGPLLQEECCGDSVMGWSLWNVSVPLQGYWPMFNPHPLHGVPFSHRYWCQPVLTLHKTSPKDTVDLWKWEFGQRQRGHPLLYSDLYNFHRPGNPDTIDNWDNGEWDNFPLRDDTTILTAKACAKACQADDRCMQWNWRGRDEAKCILMSSIRLGAAREPEVIPEPEVKDEQGNVIPPPPDRKERWVDFKAGWIKERVAKWKEGNKCDVVQWVGPSIKRIY